MTAATLFCVRGGGGTWARGSDTLPGETRRAQKQGNTTLLTVKYFSISSFLLTSLVERRHISRPEANRVLMAFEHEQHKNLILPQWTSRPMDAASPKQNEYVEALRMVDSLS